MTACGESEPKMTTSFSREFTKAKIKEQVSKFYDLGSPLYLKVYGRHIHDGYYITGKETKQQAQDNLTALLAEKGEIKPGARILDVGCGIGGSSIWLAENLRAATLGITISPVQLEIARKFAQERKVDSKFLLMDAENMEFAETFDVIWVCAAATHFNNQRAFVKRALSYLNQGGRFIIFDWMLTETVKNAAEDRYIQPVADKMLLASLYTLKSYTDWFTEAGCRIVYAEDVTGHTIKTWDDALSAIKQPGVLKLVPKMKKGEITEVLSFLSSIGPMKKAMQKGRLISGIIVAEKQ
jgi:tocopherol O-methyltransferase